MDAPVNNPDDNVAISSASVVRFLLDSETSLADPSRPNMVVHPFPFAGFLLRTIPTQRVRGYGSIEATLGSKRLFRANRRKGYFSGGQLLVQNGFVVQGYFMCPHQK